MKKPHIIKKRQIYTFLSFFVLIFFITYLRSYGEETCVKCHTDENVMKTLFKIKKFEVSEGEG